MLTDEQYAHFQQLLHTQKQVLLASKESAKDSAQPVMLDQSRVGRLSRMDAMQVQAMAQEGQRRRDIQLQRIDLALARLANGEFGLCLACDEAINIQRLDIDPTATLCIACASAR